MLDVRVGEVCVLFLLLYAQITVTNNKGNDSKDLMTYERLNNAQLSVMKRKTHNQRNNKRKKKPTIFEWSLLDDDDISMHFCRPTFNSSPSSFPDTGRSFIELLFDVDEARSSRTVACCELGTQPISVDENDSIECGTR
jgi:hypothetical protein